MPIPPLPDRNSFSPNFNGFTNNDNTDSRRDPFADQYGGQSEPDSGFSGGGFGGFGGFGNNDPEPAPEVTTEYGEASFNDFSSGFKVGQTTPTFEEQELATQDAGSEEESFITIPEDRNYSDETLESVNHLITLIASDEFSEVILNGPNEIMGKKEGARYHIPNISFKDAQTYHNVIDDFILRYTDTSDRIEKDGFLMEGQLQFDLGPDEPPVVARVHVMAPPVTKVAKVTIAKRSRVSYNIDDIVQRGSMTPGMGEFLKAAAYGRLTIVFSGLSGAGKTTLLEACSHHFDQNDRIIIVEDIPELRLPIADTVKLTATSAKPGSDKERHVTLEWLVKATNRMRPDRIIVGEVRGGEMGEFLVAANSGADGSMTTVHADNPQKTIQKMLSLAMKAEGTKSENSVLRDIASTVQLVVQLAHINGRYTVTHIEEISDTIREGTGAIATQPIFLYNRDTHTWKAQRPSESLVSFLRQRGVEVQQSWFQ